MASRVVLGYLLSAVCFFAPSYLAAHLHCVFDAEVDGVYLKLRCAWNTLFTSGRLPAAGITAVDCPAVMADASVSGNH